MRCPKCGCQDDKVIDSRASREGATIRRRRQCIACGHRFTTYEEIEHQGLMVLKRDGRHEEFSKDKLLSGIKKACQKRPVGVAKLAEVVDAVESKLAESPDREISTTDIGELVMQRLKSLDKIAYVRFASVYRDFQDVEAFLTELKDLFQRRG